MTAIIVKHATRTPINAHFYCGQGRDGDGLAIRQDAGQQRASGQLWERIAELGQAGVVNLPQYTPRIADAYRRVSERAARRNTFVPPTLRPSGHYSPLASGNPLVKSGIIRAGIRVR